MYLTKEEEKALEGEHGEWVAKAMRLLVTIGDLNNAEKLIAIKRAHLSGVSYKTVGDPILEMLEDIADSGVKVKAFTTLNPAGMDVNFWRELGFPESFARKQIRIIKAFEKIGVKLSLTCTPYYDINRPEFGEPIAFAESSAVVYTNSIIGARTNRHGSLDALAAAIIGKVPLMKLLIKENRKATILVKVKDRLRTQGEFSLLGLYVGDKLGANAIPAFKFNQSGLLEMELKSLGAAIAASGGIAMYHAIGVTPEAKNLEDAFQGDKPEEVLDVTIEDLYVFKNELFEAKGTPDLITIGCPHASLEEIELISKKIRGRHLKSGVEFWVFTSRHVRDAADQRGLISTLSESGVKVLSDTCMVVAPLEEIGFRFIMTNSGKAAFYIPKLSKNRLITDIKTLNEIIDIVFE
ncbi:MAG: aconitase X catalytic domain-containing protein [Candidatus Njordarchaeia archaeon]